MFFGCPARRMRLNRAQWEQLLEKIKHNITFSRFPCKLRPLTQTRCINYYYRPISGWEAFFPSSSYSEEASLNLGDGCVNQKIGDGSLSRSSPVAFLSQNMLAKTSGS